MTKKVGGGQKKKRQRRTTIVKITITRIIMIEI